MDIGKYKIEFLDREIAVIRFRMQQLTLEKTGKMLGVTRGRIRQIEGKAMMKLQIVFQYGSVANQYEVLNLIINK